MLKFDMWILFGDSKQWIHMLKGGSKNYIIAFLSVIPENTFRVCRQNFLDYPVEVVL